MNNPLTPSPSVNDLSKDLTTLEIQAPSVQSEVYSSEVHSEVEDIRDVAKVHSEEHAEIQEIRDVAKVQVKQQNDLKEILLQKLSGEDVNTLENEGLLDWDLLNLMEFKDASSLGLKMSCFLKLRMLLLVKFPVEKEVMVPLSKVETIVERILDARTSGIPKPIVTVKSQENVDMVKKSNKKPGKYDNVKSKVAQQWNKR